MPFKKILVPLDASELAERSLQIALELAGKFGSEVILLSVRPAPASLQADEAADDLDSFEDEGARLRTMAERHLEGTGAASHQIRTEVRAGSPEGAIIDTANDLMVDLIVMGTHGRVGLIKLLTGSITERVQAKVAASVLAVKPLGFPYLRE